jgi:hypothetical protein
MRGGVIRSRRTEARMIAIIRITAEKDTHQQPTYIYLFINHLSFAV